MHLSKCLFIAAASMAMTGVAFADEPPADPNAGGGAGASATVGGEASVGPDGAKMDANAAVAGGVYTAATWPLDFANRPQNAAKGMFEVTPTAGFYRQTNTTGDSTTDTSINVAARYGISDKLELLFGFGGTQFQGGVFEHGIILTGLEDGEEGSNRFKGTLKFGAGLNLVQGKFDAEVKAGLFYDPIFKNSALVAGVDVRYHVSDKLWIGTPQNRPGLVFGLTNFEFGGMEIPDTKPIRISIPAAVAFQATPALAIQANTRLFDINLNDAAKGGPNGDAVTFFSTDEFGGIPLDFDVVFALEHNLDVIGNLNLVDLKNAGDFLVISAGINYRM